MKGVIKPIAGIATFVVLVVGSVWGGFEINQWMARRALRDVMAEQSTCRCGAECSCPAVSCCRGGK